MSEREHREQAADKTAAIRPFHVNVPEAELAELRRRIETTRWPEKETVTEPNFSQRGASPNWGQGVQLATMQKLAHYWSTEYDWRKVEAKLKALHSSSRILMGWTFISFTFVRNMKMLCRSLLRTDGLAQSLNR